MDEFYKMKKQVEDRKKLRDQHYGENSKKRLLNNLRKKFQTTMIGSLDRFEKGFGYLWGHGKDKLTEKEEDFRDLWEDVRAEVLDNGNNQLRAAIQELSQYSIKWNKYQTNFRVVGVKNER